MKKEIIMLLFAITLLTTGCSLGKNNDAGSLTPPLEGEGGLRVE